jgi:O-antigen ligase
MGVWFILAGPASLLLGTGIGANLGYWIMLIATGTLCWIVGALLAEDPERLLRYAAWTWLGYLIWYFALGAQFLDRHPYERNGMFAVGMGAGLAAAWSFRNPWARGFVIALALWLAWLTEQRTGLVAAILCVIWVLSWMLLRRLRHWRGLLLPGLILLVLVIIVLSQPIFAWINEVLMLDDPVRGTETGFTGRTRIWAFAVIRFLESPWFGHGPGANTTIIYEVIMGQRTAHHGVLALLVDYGIFGTIPALGLFLLAIGRGIRRFWSTGETAILAWTSVIIFIIIYAMAENYWFSFGNQSSLLGLVALGVLFEMGRSVSIENVASTEDTE